MKEMVRKLGESVSKAGIVTWPDKCATIYELGSGNRWCKANNDFEPELIINTEKYEYTRDMILFPTSERPYCCR